MPYFPPRIKAKEPDSRLRLHERHAGGLVVVGVDGRHHLSAHRVEDRQCRERPRDLPVLRHAAKLLRRLLNGAVVNQLNTGNGGSNSITICSKYMHKKHNIEYLTLLRNPTFNIYVNTEVLSITLGSG